MISLSLLKQKCSITGELVPIEEKSDEALLPTEPEPSPPRAPPSPRRASPAREPTPPPPRPRTPPPAEAPPDKCPCIMKGGKGDVCGAKIKANGRCGRHKTTCFLPRVPVAPQMPEEPIIDELSQPSMRLRTPSPPPPPRARTPSPPRASQTCPCIVTTRNKEKRVCGRPIKANGHCGIHERKCILPEEEKQKPIDEDESQLPPDGPPLEPKSPPKKCPCIMKGGRGPVCGAKIKENGRCGRHQTTCHLPRVPVAPHVATPPRPRTPDEESDDEPEPVPSEDVPAPSPVVLPEQKAPSPEAVAGQWHISRVENLGEVYDYLVNLPEEVVELGEDQVYLTDQILMYLRE